MPKKGYKLTPEHKAKISSSLIGNSRRKGIPHTEDTKKKISLFMKNNPNSGQFKKGQISHNKGKPMSIESKKKLSKSRKGQVSSFKDKKTF
ncbi:MAG TPA: NUMOD3 domain-containing DNA-binding protein [Thermodesulfobacteriota bacterium]|nr:NUMOD3 domain-containing DNA-binding protein [Thermodesulfobacteriota bacterium]